MKKGVDLIQLGNMPFKDLPPVDLKDTPLVVYLPISLQNSFYSSSAFEDIIENVTKILKTGVTFLGKKTQNISKIRIDIGDTLSRYNLSQSIEGNDSEENIFKSLQKGEEWFYKNLESINRLLPEEDQLNDSFDLSPSKTLLSKGNKAAPSIEVIRHEYWRQHPEFQGIKKALDGLCALSGSHIERAFEKEAEIFCKRKAEQSQGDFNKEFVLQQSELYLKEEAVALILAYRENPNSIELYSGSENYFSQAFRGKKSRVDEEIQLLLNTILRGADKRRCFDIRSVMEHYR